MADVVDEWKEQALSLVREHQLELSGRGAIELRVELGLVISLASILGLGAILLHRAPPIALILVLVCAGVVVADWARRARARLHLNLAWAAIGKVDPFQAHAALLRLPGDQLRVDLVAAYLACCNRDDEAAQLLHDARSLGQRARETTKLMIEVLVKIGASHDAAEIARTDRRLLTLADLRALERAGIAAR